MSIVDRVIAASSQGAVGAVVGATLSAVTEPVVNKVLVERKPLLQAIEEHDMEKIKKFFETTIATNFIKFPFFEAVNVIVNSIDLPASVRGTVTGMIFTTATLPITNYRFRKSMNLPINGAGDLYQAYLPTVGRDIIYGIARNTMQAWLNEYDKNLAKSPKGLFLTMFLTVLFSCVVSAPGNELRGYWLQPAGRAKPFAEFFDPKKTIRSTTIGGLIMSTSLATGAFCTPYVKQIVALIRAVAPSDPIGSFLVILVLVDKFQRDRKLSAIAAKLDK